MCGDGKEYMFSSFFFLSSPSPFILSLSAALMTDDVVQEKKIQKNDWLRENPHGTNKEVQFRRVGAPKLHFPNNVSVSTNQCWATSLKKYLFI